MKRWMSLCASLACTVVLVWAAAAPARAAAPLVQLRVASLDALVVDVQRLARSTQNELTREELLTHWAAMVGLPDLSFVDPGKPLGLAFPVEGITLGAQSVVWVVPVKDGAQAIEVLTRARGVPKRDGDLYAFSALDPASLPEEMDPEQLPKLHVRIKDRSLVFGMVPDLVRTFDPAAALAEGDLPKGVLALALQIEPIAPLLKSALFTAKQKFAEASAAPPATPDGAAHDGAAGEENEDGAAGEGDKFGAPDGPPASASPMNLASMRPLMDVYFGVLQDAVDNLAAVQIAFDVDDHGLRYHQRMVAKTGSSLAAFIAAQRDLGLPSVGRMVPANAAMILAGQVAWTDASRAWVKQLMEGYRGAIDAFVAGLADGGADADARAFLSSAMAQNWTLSGQLFDCQRGDLAMALDFGADGMRMIQVAGLAGEESCRGVLDRLLGEARAKTGGLQITKDVLQPEKITTHVTRMKLPETLATPDVQALFGKDGIVTRSAVVGDTLISGTDPWATTAIREAAGRPGGIGGGGGVILADLGPFTAGPGFFGRIDLGTMLGGIQALTPDAKDPLPGALVSDLQGPAGKIPFAMRMDGNAATIEFALPLGLFEAFAKNAPKPPPPPADDAGLDDAIGGTGLEDDGSDVLEPIIVAGNVQPPVLVTSVEPVYPEDARLQRVQGKVILQAVIDTEGRVRSVKALRSVPLLEPAAVAAVKQWRYRPATLDGAPVPVYFTIVVTFQLESAPDPEAKPAS